jgi:uncharacterized protein (TIGR03437 family)
MRTVSLFKYPLINSAPLEVIPGSSYNLTIQARVSPSSAGNGYFALVFLGVSGTEISRATLAFAPATLQLGVTLTASDGTYSLCFIPPNPGGSQLQASLSGNRRNQDRAFHSIQRHRECCRFQIGTFGKNLGSAARSASVSVCGTPAPSRCSWLPVQGSQINALMPDSVAGQTSCSVVVTVDGQASPAVPVSIASRVMELFNFLSSAGFLAVITHADYSLVGPRSAGLIPARTGETVIAWGTGDCSNATVTVGGEAASVIFCGRVEAGLRQLNFQVPAGSSGEDQSKISTSPNVYRLPAI